MNSNEIQLELVIPTKSQTDLLYHQMSTRTHAISHSGLPNYTTHEAFVANHPYRVWYIIRQNKKDLGNIYIQNDNSIGLNCYDDINESQIKQILSLVIKSFKPLGPIPSVRANKFFLNVSASNTNLQTKLKNIGLTESQRSFTLGTDF